MRQEKLLHAKDSIQKWIGTHVGLFMFIKKIIFFIITNIIKDAKCLNACKSWIFFWISQKWSYPSRFAPPTAYIAAVASGL